MSDQARTYEGDAAAAYQQAVYARQGNIGGCCRGGARPQGYADPQVVAYESPADFVAGADQD